MKKQAKALAKRTERKAAQKATRATAAEAGVRPIRQARKYPLEGCWVQSGWQEAGLAVVIVARRQPNGLLVFGNYLVDYYCLGVKSAFARADVAPSVFYERLPTLLAGGAPTTIPPALAHELIYGSLEYAARYAFRPDPDFALAQLVLDPPDAYPRTGAVTFGKDGKPFYVSGPRDNVTAIMNTLLRTAGPDNFDYLAHIDGPPDELVAAFEDVDAVEDESPTDYATAPKPPKRALLRQPISSLPWPWAPTPRNILTSPPWSNGFGTPHVRSEARPTRRSSRTSSCLWSSSSACPTSSMTSSTRM